MIKLLTLNNLSPASSDALYKICLALDEYGMTDEDVISFGSYDELFGAVESYVSIYDRVIIAAEPADFIDLKHQIASSFGLDEVSSPNIAEAISMHYDFDSAEFDAQAQCTVPSQSVVHISSDGLYSGYSFEMLSGVCTVLALDFKRVDSVVESYLKGRLSPADNGEDEYYDNGSEVAGGYSFKDDVSKMVYSLIQSDRKLAVAMGEATTWIYNLYSEIDGLSEALSFVDIIDNEEEPEDETDTEAEETAEGEMPASESEDEQEQQQPKEKESISAKTIRHAREAMKNMDSDFGASISEVFSAEEEDGSRSFFAFVAVADEKTTKAKRVATSNEAEAGLLLAHCVSVMCETVCQKNENLGPKNDFDEPEAESEEKKLPKNMVAIIAAVAAVAVIIPIAIMIIVMHSSGNNNPTTTLPNSPVVATSDTSTTLYDPFGVQSTTGNQNDYTRAEPTASEISQQQTSAAVTSTSGKFTFYVFGYGHGCGMSQAGANWLAGLGWNYPQILANYYYGVTLVSGDTYPEQITYNGSKYNTRDFLAGVLEAEMGSGYASEALKAQAVAAYTYAKYKNFDVTSDDMAYKSNPSQACYNAVDPIISGGIYIAKNGTTAYTPFFAISAGVTCSYKNWLGDSEISYLPGGMPSYGDYNAQGFQTTYEITTDELKKLAESKPNLGISFSGDPSTWISIVSHDNAFKDKNGNVIGYVSSINVGGKIMSGNDFRMKFLDRKIRSHCFTIVYTPDSTSGSVN